MHRFWSFAVVLLPIAGCGGAKSPAPPSPTGATGPAITAADLKTRSYIFAADSMLGRRAGTLGNVRGNAYIASELARLGLKPAGDDGGYLQRIPLTSWAVDTVKTALHAGSGTLSPFRDFFPYQATYAVPARPLEGAQVMYIGGIGDTAALPSREALKGKLVVFRSKATAARWGRPT